MEKFKLVFYRYLLMLDDKLNIYDKNIINLFCWTKDFKNDLVYSLSFKDIPSNILGMNIEELKKYLEENFSLEKQLFLKRS